MSAPKGKKAPTEDAKPHGGGRPKGWKPADHGKNPGGRPLEWTPERIAEMAGELEEWAQQDDSLFFQSFCKQQGTYPQKLTELAAKDPKFSEALKFARNACESNMAEGTVKGNIPPAMGIFSLKQHNWRDKAEIEHSGTVTSKVVQINLPTRKPAP